MVPIYVKLQLRLDRVQCITSLGPLYTCKETPTNWKQCRSLPSNWSCVTVGRGLWWVAQYHKHSKIRWKETPPETCTSFQDCPWTLLYTSLRTSTVFALEQVFKTQYSTVSICLDKSLLPIRAWTGTTLITKNKLPWMGPSSITLQCNNLCICLFCLYSSIFFLGAYLISFQQL